MIRLRRVWVDRQHFFVNCYLTLPPRLSHSVRVIIDERAKIKGERGSENSNRYFVGGWERASALDSNSILDRTRCLRAILRGKTRWWRHRIFSSVPHYGHGRDQVRQSETGATKAREERAFARIWALRTAPRARVFTSPGDIEGRQNGLSVGRFRYFARQPRSSPMAIGER